MPARPTAPMGQSGPSPESSPTWPCHPRANAAWWHDQSHSTRNRDSLTNSASSDKRLGSGIFIVSRSGPSWVSDKRSASAAEAYSASSLPEQSMPFSPCQPERFAALRASVESLCRSEVVRASVNPEVSPAPPSHFSSSPPAPSHPGSLANPASPDSNSFNWLEADDEEVESAIRTSCEPNESDSGSDRYETGPRDFEESAPPLSAVINDVQPGARLSRTVSGPRQPRRKNPAMHTSGPHSIGQSPHLSVPAPPKSDPHNTLQDAAAKEELDEGYRSDATSSEESASDADSLIARRGSVLFSDLAQSDSPSKRQSTGQATYIDQSPIIPSEEEKAFWTGGSGRNSSNYGESIHQASATRAAGAWQQIEPQDLEIPSSLFPSKERQSSRQAQKSLVLPAVTTLTARAPRRTDLRWRQSRIPVNARKRLSVLNSHDDAFPYVDGASDRRASHRFSNSFDDIPSLHKLPHSTTALREGRAARESGDEHESVHKAAELAEDDSDEYEASESSAFSYAPDVQVHTATKLAINLTEAEVVRSPSFHRVHETRILKAFGVQTEPLEAVPTSDGSMRNDHLDGQHQSTDQPRAKKRPDLRIDTGQRDSSRSSVDLKLIAVQVGSGKVVSPDSEKGSDAIECPQCGHSFEPSGSANKDASLATSVSEARKLAYARVRARAEALAKVSSSALKSASKLAGEVQQPQVELEPGQTILIASDANARAEHQHTPGNLSSSADAPTAHSVDIGRRINSRVERELPIAPESDRKGETPSQLAQSTPSLEASEDLEAKGSKATLPSALSRKRNALGRWNAGSDLHSRGSSFQSFVHPFDSRPGSAFSNSDVADMSNGRGRRGSDRGRSSSEEAESISSTTLLSRLRASSSHLQELTTLNGCLPIGAFKSGGSSSNSSALGKSFDSHAKRTSNTSLGLQQGGSVTGPATAGYFLPPLASHAGTSLQGSLKAKDSALSLQEPRELSTRSPDGGAVPASDENEDDEDEDDEPQPTPPCRSAKALKVLGLETQPGMPGQLVNAPDPIVPVHPAGYDLGLPSLPSSLKKRRSTSFSAEQDNVNTAHVPVISGPFNVEHVASANTNMGLFTSPSSTTAPETPAVHSAAAILERTEKIAAGPDSSPTRPIQRFKHVLRLGRPSTKEGGGIEYGSYPNDPLPLPPAIRPPPLKRGVPFATDGTDMGSSSSVLSKFRHRRGESDLVQGSAPSASAPPTGQGGNGPTKTTPPGRLWALPSLDLNDSSNFKLHSFEMGSSDETPRNTAHEERTSFVHGELANASVL